MAENVKQQLIEFTKKYVEQWFQQTGHEPSSEELYGLPSPCTISNNGNQVFWLPQPFKADSGLFNIENAMDIPIHSDIHQFYTSQYAGDLSVLFDGRSMSLIQVWSDEDFIRLQENLIGHLFTQRKLKLSPTLFIATLDSELEVISVCNITGAVMLEYFGSKKRQILSHSLIEFLNSLKIVINCK